MGNKPGRVVPVDPDAFAVETALSPASPPLPLVPGTPEVPATWKQIREWRKALSETPVPTRLKVMKEEVLNKIDEYTGRSMPGAMSDRIAHREKAGELDWFLKQVYKVMQKQSNLIRKGSGYDFSAPTLVGTPPPRPPPSVSKARPFLIELRQKLKNAEIITSNPSTKRPKKDALIGHLNELWSKLLQHYPNDDISKTLSDAISEAITTLLLKGPYILSDKVEAILSGTPSTLGTLSNLDTLSTLRF